jgi:hypothetical protein
MPGRPLNLLVDNGSLQPAATLALRGLAARLGERLGEPVEAVSLLHSSGIDPRLLAGQPAEILFPALEKHLAAGEAGFVIVPLFFGPSQALTVYLPENFARLRLRYPAFHARVAAPLHAAGDDRLARILADQVRRELTNAGPGVRVALVDHGSPVRAVTAVRNELATQLATLLGAEVAAVAPCSMERRSDPAYDFCAPLLADLLGSPPWSTGRVVVAMQFLLPGRHAGPVGDVAEICRRTAQAHPELRAQMTDLVGSHPLLVEILADRWAAAH